jgi:hypothetical protein
VRGWGHPLDSWPGCLPVDCQCVLHNSSVRSSSYSCSKVSPKRSTPLQIHVSHLLIKHGSMRPEVTQRGNRCRERHVVIAAMYEQRPTAAATLAHAPGCLTGIVSHVSALEARTTGERRHDVAFFRLFCKECEYAVAGLRIAKRGVASHGGVLSRAAIANDALRRRIAGCTGQCCEREGSTVPASVLSSIPSPARLCQSKFFSDIIEGHTRQRGRARAEWNHLSRAHNSGLGKRDEIEGGATYCQTSNPSLSNSTSTTSEDKWNAW